MTIYIVTDGCYSDYRIRGVFMTKENADKFMAAYDFDSPNIEEYEADKMDERIQNGLKRYQVEMRKDGNEAKAELTNPVYEDEHKDYIRKERVFTGFQPGQTSYGSMYEDTGHELIENTVWAKDEKHAIKIANEKRTRCIAENRWIVKD